MYVNALALKVRDIYM